MLQSLDDTIQLQSEALWERYRQRSVNANVALAAKVISATSHIQTQQLRDGYTAFAYKVAPFCANLPTQVQPGRKPVSYLDQNLALFLPVSISLSLYSPCVS